MDRKAGRARSLSDSAGELLRLDCADNFVSEFDIRNGVQRRRIKCSRLLRMGAGNGGLLSREFVFVRYFERCSKDIERFLKSLYGFVGRYGSRNFGASDPGCL